MWTRGWIIVVACALVGGCGGDRVQVVAHLLSGPEGPGATAALAGAAPADGAWLLSPDQVTADLTTIAFDVEGGGGRDAQLADCSVTFERDAPALSNLLDCTFELPPGTYTGMSLISSPTFQLLVSDPVDGFFTDPDATGGLTATMPAGGAAPVTYTTSFGTSFGQAFAEPLVVEDGAAPSISIVLDALQSVRVSVSGGVPAFTDGAPMFVFPTVGAPGRAQYYSSAGTAASRREEPPDASTALRVYSAPGSGQPIFVQFAQATNGIAATCLPNAGLSAAYAADPDEHEPSDAGDRPGGWLGRDDGGTLCWALGTDRGFHGYAAYLTLPEVTTIGDSALLSCEVTSTPTPPASGSTYASGCPAVTITGDASETMILVAQ